MYPILRTMPYTLPILENANGSLTDPWIQHLSIICRYL